MAFEDCAQSSSRLHTEEDYKYHHLPNISDFNAKSHPQNMGSQQPFVNNHSTIQLDGEKSMNENTSLHFVSFFSACEDNALAATNIDLKKNLLSS